MRGYRASRHSVPDERGARIGLVGASGEKGLDMRRWGMLFLALWLCFAPSSLFACTCSPPSPFESFTVRQLVQRAFDKAELVCEGRVESVQDPPNPFAPDGTILLPVPARPLRRVVRFRDTTVYKGQKQGTIVIRTGLGCGDCGYGFEVGSAYLVYAYTNEDGNLETNICTRTSLADDAGVDLRFLRGQAPALQDSLDPQAYFKQATHERTGTICGRVLRPDGKPLEDASVSLWAARDTPFRCKGWLGEVKADGSFCATVYSGKYFLGSDADESLKTSSRLAGFYPGVPHVSQATPIDVQTGVTISGFQFALSPQSLYELRGRVVTSDGSPLPTSDMQVAIWNADNDPLCENDTDSLEEDGRFDFDSVPPGRYVLVPVWSEEDEGGQASSPKWKATKLEINVPGAQDNLILTLEPVK